LYSSQNAQIGSWLIVSQWSELYENQRDRDREGEMKGKGNGEGRGKETEKEGGKEGLHSIIAY
jgi:hypothetical protein